MDGLGWVRVSRGVWALCLLGCGPSVTDADGTGGQGSEDTSTDDSSGGADTSTTAGELPPVDFPTRVLYLRATPEGGTALEVVELDGDPTPRAMHPELAPTTIVEDYVALAGTDRVAFVARAGVDEPARVYTARADAGAPGSSSEIDVDGDVLDIAWVKAAGTLVVATSSATYRVEIGVDGPGEPAEIDGPSGPVEIAAIDSDGMRVAADFSTPGEPGTCFVASVDPTSPTDWVDAYDGPDTECYVEGFGPDAFVFATGGTSPPLSLWRSAFVDGALQPAVRLAENADYVVEVGRHGIAYRTEAQVRDLVYIPVDDGAIGEARVLSDGVTSALFDVSRDGRTLVFGEQGVAKLLDLSQPGAQVLPLPLPEPYRGSSSEHATSQDGAYVFIVGSTQASENYWEETQALWRIDVSDGVAKDPVRIVETSPTQDGVNSSSIETLALSPSGNAIAYSRIQPSTFGDGGDVGIARLDPDGVGDMIVLDGSNPTSLVTYSADGEHVAFGNVVVATREGEVIGGSGVAALAWSWWEPG